MRVAGFGFTSRATLASLRSALGRAGGGAGLTALATAADKADATAIRALAQELGLPLHAVALEQLAVQAGASLASAVPARYGARSLAEAAALAAAGPGARLVGTRVVSDDRLATAAIAERAGK